MFLQILRFKLSKTNVVKLRTSTALPTLFSSLLAVTLIAFGPFSTPAQADPSTQNTFSEMANPKERSSEKACVCWYMPLDSENEVKYTVPSKDTKIKCKKHDENQSGSLVIKKDANGDPYVAGTGSGCSWTHVVGEK